MRFEVETSLWSRTKRYEISEEDESGLLSNTWEVPWHAHAVPLLIVIVLSIVLFLDAANQHPALWRLSWGTLERGEFAPAYLHIFAHAGYLHLLTNCAALLLLGGPLVATLGTPPASWLRFVYLFVGSGLCGAALFLLLKFDNPSPLLGASGAIFGVLGALARVHPLTGAASSISSRRTWLLAKFFIHNHLVLFAIVALVALTTGQATFLAWEAHLGGLLFGFFAAPAFLERHTSTEN